MKIDAFCHIMPRPYYDRFFTLDETLPAEQEAIFRGNVTRLTGLTVKG